MERLIEELFYNNYLAERDLLNELATIDNNANYFIEADGNSDRVKRLRAESILKYLRKIIANIQNVWDKFKAGVNNQIWEETKKRYEKTFKMNRNITLQEVTEKDLVPNIKEIREFISQKNGVFTVDMLHKYENKDQILHALFDYFGDTKANGPDLKKFITDKCFTNAKPNMEITGDMIRTYVAFMDDYKDNANKVADDIRNINSAERTAEELARNIPSQQEQKPETPTQSEQQQKTEESVKVLANKLARYITELTAVDSQDPDGSEKVSNDGNRSKNPAKDITNFFQVYTLVLSLKMFTLNKGKAAALKLIRLYGNNALGYVGADNEEKKEETKPEEKPKDTKDQVDI